MVAIVVELIKQIPTIVTEFINGLIDGASRFIDALISFLGGGKEGGAASKLGLKGIPVVGGIVDAIGGIFGFADGGVVPQGFPNDTFPAKLSSGEMVLNKEQQDRLFNAQSSGAQNITINLVLGEQQLATAILNLNRRGFRTAI